MRLHVLTAHLRSPQGEMTSCAARVPAKALSSYIKRVGTAMVSDKERDRVLVQELLLVLKMRFELSQHAAEGHH